MITANSSVKFHVCLYLIVLFLVYSFDGFFSKLPAQSPAQKPVSSQTTVQKELRPFHTGDAVEILVYPDTSSFLHGVFPIDGNGNVYLPLSGNVGIADMTESEFVQFINENYKQYIRTPDIQVKPLIRASMLGGFNTPGLVYIDKNATLWELIRRGGGTELEDGLKKMKWERNKNTIQSNLMPLYESGRSLSDIGFRSGDQLWAPSPDREDFWDKLNQFLPLVTVTITSLTLYYTVYVTARR